MELPGISGGKYSTIQTSHSQSQPDGRSALHSSTTHSSGHRCGNDSRRHDRRRDSQAYPDLEPEDIHEALRYAAEAVREGELPLVTG